MSQVSLTPVILGWEVVREKYSFESGQENNWIVEPVTCTLVECDSQLGLIDTGTKFPAKVEVSNSENFILLPQETLDPFGKMLETLDIATKDIDFVLLSHLHSDHAGNLDYFCGTNTPIYVNSQELRYALKAFSYATNEYHYDYLVSLKINWVDSNRFFNTNLCVVNTPGHTPGHLSFTVLNEKHFGKHVILCCDAADLEINISKQITGLLPDEYKREAQASLAKLIAYNNDGYDLIPGHDPEFWQRMSEDFGLNCSDLDYSQALSLRNEVIG